MLCIIRILVQVLGSAVPVALRNWKLAVLTVALNIPRHHQERSRSCRRSARQYLFPCTANLTIKNLLICNIYPAAGLDVLHMKEAEHGVEICLKDLEGGLAGVQCKDGCVNLIQKRLLQTPKRLH